MTDAPKKEVSCGFWPRLAKQVPSSQVGKSFAAQYKSGHIARASTYNKHDSVEFVCDKGHW
jgi:hypothetical protein